MVNLTELKAETARMKKPTEYDVEVAQEILRQLGGFNRLKVMVGAKPETLFVHTDRSVSFKIAKRVHINIKLDASDTYLITVKKPGCGPKKYDYKTILQESDIYSEMLLPTLEKATKMHWSL